MSFPEHLRVGTSSWSKDDWIGSFYSPHLNRGQFIEAYARQFNSVEIDSTYYSMPTPQTVTHWRWKTPPGLSFYQLLRWFFAWLRGSFQRIMGENLVRELAGVAGHAAAGKSLSASCACF